MMNASCTLVIALLCALLVSPVARAERTEITPDWANENPGRLTLGTGSAFGGWNEYFFALHFDSPRIFSIRSTVLLDRGGGKGKFALHSFSWTIQEPSTRLPLRMATPSYTPPYDEDGEVAARADAKVNIVVKHLDPNGKETGEIDRYDLTLSDFKGVYSIPSPSDDEDQEIEQD